MFGSSTSARTGAMRLALAFAAGFISVLVFHQAMLAILHLAGITPALPWTMSRVPPLGVPQVISAAFWGGVWAILLALVLQRTRSAAAYWITAVVFGALALSLVAWFVVAPLKGQPVAGGWQPARLLTALLVNGAWGFGTALLLSFAPGWRLPRSAGWRSLRW